MIGTVGTGRPAHTWEQRVLPWPFSPNTTVVGNPGQQAVEDVVHCVFRGELQEEPFARVMLVAKELVRNAERHGVPPVGVLRPGLPKITLTLGWVFAERGLSYAAVMVSDLDESVFEGPSRLRSGLGRVIALTERCGVGGTTSGKQVWALIDAHAE